MGRKKELYEVLRKYGVLEQEEEPPREEEKRLPRKESLGFLKSFGEKEITLSYNGALAILLLFLILLTLSFLWGSYAGGSPEQKGRLPLKSTLPAEAEKRESKTEKQLETVKTERRYTVQAITYSFNSKNKERADKLAKDFEKRGYGTARVKRVDSKLIVCVGFFETKEDAQRMRDAVANIKLKIGNNREELPFEDAIVRSVRVPVTSR